MTELPSQPFRAALMMIGTVASFTAMAVAAREASTELSAVEILFYRSVSGIFIVVAIGAVTGTLSTINTRNFGLQCIRNICQLWGTVFWLFAISAISFAQVFTFEFTTPLWTTVLASLFLGERLTTSRVATAIAGFVGIVVVARPGLVEISPGVLAAIFCAVGFAGSAVATRKLVHNASVTNILFWMVFMLALFAAAIAGHDGVIAIPTWSVIDSLIVVSVSGVAAHYFLSSALSLAPAVVVMPMDFLRLPVIAIIGALFYDELLESPVLIGAAIILIANFINVRIETRSGKLNR